MLEAVHAIAMGSVGVASSCALCARDRALCAREVVKDVRCMAVLCAVDVLEFMRYMLLSMLEDVLYTLKTVKTVNQCWMYLRVYGA